MLDIDGSGRENRGSEDPGTADTKSAISQPCDGTVFGGVWMGVDTHQLAASDNIGASVSDEFGEFYRQHYPAAVRLAWLLTHDHSSTDDAVQDAFVRMRPRFETVADGPAYLRMCIVNGCMSGSA